VLTFNSSSLLVIRATHTQEVLGEQGRRIRELTSLIQKRFKFPENSVSLYAAKVQNRGLSAVAQCESLRYKLLNGLAVRRACYGVLRFIMESGAKGCEVVVSGKLRAARAKSMKFTVRLLPLCWITCVVGKRAQTERRDSAWLIATIRTAS
jgi:small subunit ribosomal protein S3e